MFIKLLQKSKIKNVFLSIFLLIHCAVSAQCISGNCIDGQGEKKYADSSRFVGFFEKGAKKTGTNFYKNGDTYQGAFSKNLRNGFAIYTYKNGEEFKGNFVNDKKEFGTYKFANGSEYTGTFENNKPHGFGIIKQRDGTKWEGNWENGKKVWGATVNNYSTDSVVATNWIADSLSNINKQNSKSISPRIFTVVVGVSDYEGTLADLNYSDDDAELFLRHLNKAFPSELANGKSILLLNQNATYNNIVNALQQVFSQSTENDFIIFYFSGHGSPGYFCPTDYTSNKVSHDLVKEYFKKSKAKYRLCIADACFSGSIGSNQSNNNYENTQNLRDQRLAVIMSSKPSQTSAETTQLKQGLFSYYLLRGLRGSADLNNDTYVTMGELFIYTKNIVSQKSNGSQIPVVYGVNLDRIPLAKIKK
jgi:hypothetical protein